MSKVKKISVVIITLLMVVCIFNSVVYADNFDVDAFEEPGEVGNVKNLVNNTSKTIITTARIICVSIAIVILLFISMKYMVSAPGDRADIKKHAVHYIVSALILFGVTGILTIISNLADAIKAS